MADPSDKPLVVDGITVMPRWSWSPEFRGYFAQRLREFGRHDGSPGERARAYIEWLAAKRGITRDDALARISAQDEQPRPARRPPPGEI